VNKPPHVIDIFLQPGEFYFGDRNTRIRTLLGSCVSITMWHPTLLIGGMCHYMLASSPQRKVRHLDGKYGEDAILLFFLEAIRNNSDPKDYVVKIFGGGNMFPKHRAHLPCETKPCKDVIDNCHNVSCKNSMIGQAILEREGFKIAAAHVGGTGHRQILFDVWSGHVWLRHTEIMKQAS